MKQNQQELKRIDHDARNNPLMTLKTIKYYCEKEGLYETPELNEKLYLHFKGFRVIDSLENYPNLATIWLNNNCIEKISGLSSLNNLVCLYLNNNAISKIQNLEGLTNLSILNLSHNKIEKIENLRTLPNLSSLNVSQNFLYDVDSIDGLLQSETLTNLNLSKNELENSEKIMNLITKLQNISCLYLKNTPLSRGFKYYRKIIIGSLKKLKFLDDRPVQQIDHRLCQAWLKGGAELEKQERLRISNQKQIKQQYQSKETKKSITHGQEREKQRLQLQQKKKQLQLQGKADQRIQQIDRKLQIIKNGPKGFQAAITDTSIRILHIDDEEQQQKIIQKYFKTQKQIIDENINKLKVKQLQEKYTPNNADQKSRKVCEILKLDKEEAIEDNAVENIYKKYWNANYEILLETLLEKYRFDFEEVQPSFNMILAEINKKMVRPHRRFQVRELQKIWTQVQIKKRNNL